MFNAIGPVSELNNFILFQIEPLKARPMSFLNDLALSAWEVEIVSGFIT